MIATRLLASDMAFSFHEFGRSILERQLETLPTDDLVSSLASVGSKPPAVSGRAVRVGSVSRSDFDSPDLLAPEVAELAAVYAQLGRGFVVPYFEVDG